MKGGARTTPAPDPEIDAANVQPEGMATNQEATVVPWLCGEQKVALRWISPAYNQFTAEAPVERPGKK